MDELEHEPWKICLLEDNSDDALLIVRRLVGVAVVKIIRTRADYERALLSEPMDCILADWSVPGFREHDALKMRQAIAPRTPFIYVTGTLENKEAALTLKLGASDYVLKEGLERLEHSIATAIELAKARVPGEAHYPVRPAILLVEDSEDLLELLVQLFVVQNAEIATAGTVRDALHLVNTRQFHVAMVDLKLSDGNGIEVVRRLREVARNTMTIIVSGHPNLGEMLYGLPGYFGIVQKPFTVSVAHEILRKHRLSFNN